ncbi:MAG: DinB family protein [Acidobacteria bacterium]|nr:DinB family protein [Acidobacteriota bacterium]
MQLAQGLLSELESEAATTRKLLELCPEDQAGWKPHAKSFSLGDLALHLSNIPGWTTSTLAGTELDLAPPGGGGFKPPEFESMTAVLDGFDANVRGAIDALGKASNEDLGVGWSLKNAGETLFTMPRMAVLRVWVLNHLIHHRGQLSVYLRLLDIPLPSIYGPTADTEG